MQTIIKIDWDKKTPPDCGLLAKTVSKLDLAPFYMQLKPSSSHWHVIIETSQPLTDTQIVAVQLLLGSDPHRELYNLYRVLCKDAPRYWRERWNVLFKREKENHAKKSH